jgi:hypothetical protein
MIDYIKGILFNPRVTFERIRDDEISDKKIYLIFLSVFLLILSESILTGNKGHAFRETFGPTLDAIYTFLSYPVNATLVNYVFYFLFILITIGLCKIVNYKKYKCKKLPQLLMSISVLGFIIQLLLLFNKASYVLFEFSFSYALRYLGYIFLIWNMILVFLAIKIAGSLSTLKTIIIFSIIIILFAFVSPIGMWSGMKPYFMNVLGR